MNGFKLRLYEEFIEIINKLQLNLMLFSDKFKLLILIKQLFKNEVITLVY